MAFYIFNLFALSGVLLLLKDRKQKISFAFLWLFLLSACRNVAVGEDNANYMRYFGWYSDISWKDSFFQQEGGYWLLNKVINYFGGTFQILLLVCAALSMLGVCYFIYKYSYYPGLSVWMYITFLGYQSTMTRLRQAIAISIVLIAYHFAKNKKLLVFCLLIVLASMFHITAIVAIVVYPFMDKKVSQKFIGIAFGTITLLYITRNYVFILIRFIMNTTRYSHYQTSSEGGGEFQLLLIAAMLTVIMFVAYKYRDTIRNKDFSTLFNYAVFALMFQIFALVIGIFNRLANYFYIPLVILLPNVIVVFEKRQRVLVAMLLLLLSLLSYIFMFYYSDSSVMNYIPFWKLA